MTHGRMIRRAVRATAPFLCCVVGYGALASAQELLVNVAFSQPHPPYVAVFYKRASLRSRGDIVEATFVLRYEDNLEGGIVVAADCRNRLIYPTGHGLARPRDSDEWLARPGKFEKDSLEEDLYSALCRSRSRG